MGVCQCLDKKETVEIEPSHIESLKKKPNRLTENSPKIDLFELVSPSAKNAISILSGELSLSDIVGEVTQLEDGSYQRGKERVFPDGSYAKGDWVGGFLSGEGVLIAADGSYSIGTFKKSKLWGEGRKTDIGSGAVYEGIWKSNKLHGSGSMIWKGIHFEGDFCRGRKRGFGRLTMPDGSLYEGEFYDDLFRGEGTYTWADGRVYTGCWKNNKMNGFGKFVWPDGRIYQGQYLDDKKHGFGVFTWPSGKRYEGQWKDGLQDGEGTLVGSDGLRRDGEWTEGKKVRWAM